ncbi:MAG TPA: hypothetical protein VHL50_02750, partial [Pyrinomonadaceae bacterium]|nr:hypothetical protein [Pyrinomonadaceae bacterium]
MKRVEVSDPVRPKANRDNKQHAAAFKTWRRRLSYFSVLTAIPIVIGWQTHEVRADELTAPT